MKKLFIVFTCLFLGWETYIDISPDFVNLCLLCFSLSAFGVLILLTFLFSYFSLFSFSTFYSLLYSSFYLFLVYFDLHPLPSFFRYEVLAYWFDIYFFCFFFFCSFWNFVTVLAVCFAKSFHFCLKEFINKISHSLYTDT